MTTITSAQAGDWSATSTWTGGVVPTQSNIAQINHLVTLDVVAAVGAIDPASVGSLINTSTNGISSPLQLRVGPTGIVFKAVGVT